MMENKYLLRYLPKYEKDLNEIIDYIGYKHQSPENAIKLINKFEEAILERLNCPLSFEPFQSNRKREHSYYRIYVGNFIIFYVVIDDIMEVRRVLYKSRDLSKIQELK